jgi:phage terminase large subunit-like protein
MKGRKPSITALNGALDKAPPAPAWLPRHANNHRMGHVRIGVDLSKVTDLCAVSACIQMPEAANDAAILVGNLVFMEDASGNRRPHKAKSIDRIDAAVSSIMAVGRAAANARVSGSYVNEKWANGLAFA